MNNNNGSNNNRKGRGDRRELPHETLKKIIKKKRVKNQSLLPPSYNKKAVTKSKVITVPDKHVYSPPDIITAVSIICIKKTVTLRDVLSGSLETQRKFLGSLQKFITKGSAVITDVPCDIQIKQEIPRADLPSLKGKELIHPRENEKTYDFADCYIKSNFDFLDNPRNCACINQMISLMENALENTNKKKLLYNYVINDEEHFFDCLQFDE